jgi:cytochrome c peroxidase
VFRLLAAAVSLSAALTAQATAAPAVPYSERSPFRPDAVIPAPAEAPLGEAVFRLGERLFHDPLLSGGKQRACSTCHLPQHGFAEPLPRALGDATLRNTPSLFNRAYGKAFSWDGKAATLEAQVLLPIENPKEMALPIADAVARLGADPGYAAAFRETLGEPPSAGSLGRALATYVRGLTLGDSPIDRFLRNQPSSLTREERIGLWVFDSKGRCWRCHVQPNFTDEQFHNTGVGAAGGEPTDPGRMAVTGDARDRGAFKTPTLRGLVHTAPYMHDGSLATLEEVVAFYRRGGNRNPWVDAELEPLELTDDEAAHLVAFLRALSRVEAR